MGLSVTNGERDKALKQVDDRDYLNRMAAWSRDVLEALEANPEVITRSGINIMHLVRLSGLSKERIRKVLTAWREQYGQDGDYVYDK